MIIDKKTGALTELSQGDIGNKVEGVIVRCGHILFQQPGSTFQAFVTDAGISCSLKSPLQISAGISYKVSGTVGQYRDKPQLTISSIELVQDDESGFAVYSRFLSGAFEDIGITPKIADKIAKVCKDNLVEELMKFRIIRFVLQLSIRFLLRIANRSREARRLIR